MRPIRIGTLRLAAALSLAALACTQAAAQRTPGEVVVDTGTLNGAPYRIEIPAEWNGGLVMYAHGYEIEGTPFAPEAPRHAQFREAFTSRGFAFAQSWYRAYGWAVREGMEDTEALRLLFAARYGAPDSTFLTGNSMGGLITVATMETRPEAYEGALPLCALLAPPLESLRRLFDLLAAYDWLFPGMLTTAPGGLAELPATPLATRDAIAAAAHAQPERAEALGRRYRVRPQNLPGVVWFFAAILGELRQRAGGNPFETRGTVYHGLGDDTASARGVRRYAADPAAVAWLRERFSPTGRIADPVLAVHTTYDPVVEPDQMDDYRALAQLAGNGDRFAAAYVVADGHCAFTPAQVGAAFDALRTWAATGARPAEGELR